MGWKPMDPYLQSCLRIQDKKQTILAHDKVVSAVLELPGRQARPWTRLDASPGLMSDIQGSTRTDSEVTSGKKPMSRRLCFPSRHLSVPPVSLPEQSCPRMTSV